MCVKMKQTEINAVLEVR